MSNAAYELELNAPGAHSFGDNPTTIDAFDDTLQAKTKAMPFAMMLGKAIAETELERAEWDISDEIPKTLQDLEWLQRASQDTREIEAAKAQEKRKSISRAWLISICFSGFTALAALTAVNGIPEDIRSLGIKPVFAETTTKTNIVDVQAKNTTPTPTRIITDKYQGRWQPSEPLPTTTPTRVVEDSVPTKVSDAGDTARFKVSSRF